MPECIPLRSWVDHVSCPLPKPPCRPWPRSLALQSHFSQERTDQIRSLLSQPTVLPSRRVFGTRPTMPRPCGPVRPAEPSSTAQLQATLKDKCTAEWILILKSCVASSKLAQALEALQHPQILVEASLRKFSGGTLSQYLRAIRLFLTFVHQCVGDLLSLTLAHLSDFIAGCHVSQAEDRTALKCSAIMMSKALSWFARIGQISSLLDLMGSPLIKSFAYNPKRPTGSLALATGHSCSMGGTHSLPHLHARCGPVTRRPAFVRPKIWRHSENQALCSLSVCAGT